MLSLFPSLLFFGSVFVPLVLRLTVSLCVGSIAYRHLANRETFSKDLSSWYGSRYASQLALLGGIIEALIAISLFVGFYTQLAALLAAILFVKIIYFKKRMPYFGTESTNFYWLLFVLSVLVLFAGPGPFGFDLPL